MRKIFTLLAVLFLSGCATAPSVQVRYAVPVPLDFNQPIEVQSQDQALQWATETALRQSGWQVGTSSLKLKVFESQSQQVRVYQDPFCDPWRYGYPRGYYGGYGFGYGSRWGCAPPDTQVIPTRTLTWSLEERDGQVLWTASTREYRPMGPPIELSDRLAQSLIEWQHRSNP